MTGWGQDGPLAARAGHDINYIALAGALRPHRPAGASAPVPPLNLVGDFGGGGCCSPSAWLRALLERRRSGQGQVVDAAMVDGAALLMTMFHGLRRHAASGRDERGTNLLDTGAPLLRRLRDAPTASTSSSARSSRSSTPSCSSAPASPATTLPGQMDRTAWPALKERLAAHLQDQDARRVVRDHGGHRRLLRARAHDRPRRRSTRTTQARGTFVEVAGVVAAGAGAPLQPHPRRPPGATHRRQRRVPRRLGLPRSGPTTSAPAARSPKAGGGGREKGEGGGEGEEEGKGGGGGRGEGGGWEREGGAPGVQRGQPGVQGFAVDVVAGGEDPGGAVGQGVDGRLAVQAEQDGPEGLLGQQHEHGDRGGEEKAGRSKGTPGRRAAATAWPSQSAGRGPGALPRPEPGGVDGLQVTAEGAGLVTARRCRPRSRRPRRPSRPRPARAGPPPPAAARTRVGRPPARAPPAHPASARPAGPPAATGRRLDRLGHVGGEVGHG